MNISWGKATLWSFAYFLALTMGDPAAIGQPPAAPQADPPAVSTAPQRSREASLRAIASYLELGSGAVIADIGAGDGPDVWVFADLVGTDGKVLAEEIDEAKVTAIREQAAQRNLSQVEAILGTPDDPCLPAKCVDMAFMHFVYHHVTQPQAMLQGIWKSLKPGGYLVIVDQRLGTLTDWVPREERGKKHYWIAETTIVREAREQGFRFVDYAELYWHAQEPFVLVFQRPFEMTDPGCDPDPASPIPESVAESLVPAPGETYERIALVALDEGRTLIGPILQATACPAVDIILEEWATQKEERPPLPAGVTLPSVLTEQGDPRLSSEPLDAVYFLDSYHRLFHSPALLAHLHQRLKPSGRVYILDRQAPHVMPHREASHRRMIAAETVIQEMNDAHFRLLQTGTCPTPERFLMVFGREQASAPPATDGTP